MDPRAQKLAEIFVNHSVKVTSGSNVIIDASDLTAIDLIKATYIECLKKDANVYIDIMGINYQITRADNGGLMNDFLNTANQRQLSTPPEIMSKKLDWADKIIRLTTIHNPRFLSDVNQSNLRTWSNTIDPVFNKILDLDWVLTYVPTVGRAQNAGMSLDSYTDFYYDACIIDYKKQAKSIEKIQNILDAGSVVKIIGKNTDLTIGIKGRLAAGTNTGIHNIPDGECFIAPLETETTGYITFELPQIRSGNQVQDIYLEFKKGSVVNFSAQTGADFFEKTLNDHQGNKRLGELGIGMNSKIQKYMLDTLFDEKIMGTLHFALGSAYEYERGGGKNKGTVHWDLVKDFRYKGSLVTVDNTPILKDGRILV